MGWELVHARSGSTASVGKVLGMSASPQSPDVSLRRSELTLCATTGLMHRSQRSVLYYSIISSASASTEVGISRAEQLGGLEADHQLVLVRCLHRHCATAAETTKSESDRAIWLGMSAAWRDLATIAEEQASTIQSQAAAA
jgi:hypothetical protein